MCFTPKHELVDIIRDINSAHNPKRIFMNETQTNDTLILEMYK